MKKYLFLVFFILNVQIIHGKAPQVPTIIQFADIKLHLTEGARKRIQEKVNGLTQSDKYFQNLLNRVNLFFPIVERVLKEEKLPLDFKYLVIQESGLVADAVSTSRAVGFWQFKEAAAQEVGLKINQHIDERMHIEAATRAAARYLKQHNQEFNNWLYSLLAYNMGRGGARKLVKKRYVGARAMKIEGQAHVYIIHFLAYTIAFAQVIGRDRHPELHLHKYAEGHGKTLDEIANEFGVDRKQVREYNKWLKRYRIPYDTNCFAIIPMTHQQYAHHIASLQKPNAVKRNIDRTEHHREVNNYPIIGTHRRKKRNKKVTTINKIAGVVAPVGADARSLARLGNVSFSQFLAFNDLEEGHAVIPGQVYYYKHKRSKASVLFHVVQPGDTWWSVSQKYGIKKKALLLKNRLRCEVALKNGRVLWLRCIRPSKIPVAYKYALNQAN